MTIPDAVALIARWFALGSCGLMLIVSAWAFFRIYVKGS